MADDREAGPQVLDYGVETPQPLRRRDSREYYREPPALSEASVSDVVIWFVSFLGACVVILCLVGHWWSAAWT